MVHISLAICAHAAAMVVRDLLKDRKFDNCRDSARVLISIPYHIRRPDRQLVEEFAQLESADLKCEYAERALPTMLGHLVKKTCMRAGGHKQDHKVQMEKLDQKEQQVHKDHREYQEQTEQMGQPVQQEQQVHKDQQDQQVRKDHRE